MPILVIYILSRFGSPSWWSKEKKIKLLKIRKEKTKPSPFINNRTISVRKPQIIYNLLEIRNLSKWWYLRSIYKNNKC